MDIGLILNIIMLIFLGYLTLFKKYFEKKGENVATKEDVAEITRLTERSKVEFVKQLEEYKKELNLRYEFIELTKEYEIQLFKKTVVLRKNLIRWGNNHITETLVQDTLELIQEILIDLFSNNILFNQYSSSHQNIEKEYNSLVYALKTASSTINPNFDKTSLENEIKKLQDDLIGNKIKS